jgi:hypothetical protein
VKERTPTFPGKVHCQIIKLRAPSAPVSGRATNPCQYHPHPMRQLIQACATGLILQTYPINSHFAQHKKNVVPRQRLPDIQRLKQVRKNQEISGLKANERELSVNSTDKNQRTPTLLKKMTPRKPLEKSNSQKKEAKTWRKHDTTAKCCKHFHIPNSMTAHTHI